MSGANLIYGMGMLESGMTWSHEQFMIDNDIVNMIKRVIQGIEVNDDTMAVDLIKQAHEIKNFLNQDHTRQYMRKHSKPALFDRGTRMPWEAKGVHRLNSEGEGKTPRILKTHQPEPLSDEVKKRATGSDGECLKRACAQLIDF